MPVVPFTHHHRRHPIAHHDDCSRDCDLDHVTADDIRTFDDGPADDDQAVTVADLLDAYDALRQRDKPGDLGDRVFAWEAVRNQADDDTVQSYQRVRDAIFAHGDLSPEERAEFDRRTT